MVKNGYKQTEFGVIPEDWEIKRFSQLFTIGHGKDQKTIETKDGKYPILATSGIVGYTNSYLWDKSSALIGRKGTINKPQYIETPFWTIDTLFYTKIFDDVFPKYIYYLFCTIDWLSLNEASGVPSLSANNIEKISYAIPSFEEQNLISEALSDVDSLIISLEKLIAKKKAIKQGAMQELLTGRKRLPGFAGEWGKYELGFVCSILNGDRGINYPKDTEMTSYGVPFINAGHIKNNAINYRNMDYISYDHYQKLSGAKLKIGDILFCLRGSLGKYAMINNNEGAPASSLCVIRTNNVLKAEYLFQLLGTNMIQNQVINANSGSSQPNISADNIKHFGIFIPKHINEQIAIASILSDMDSEIEALEEKLEKIRQVKQGMMQELLTGRIRLV